MGRRWWRIPLAAAGGALIVHAGSHGGWIMWVLCCVNALAYVGMEMLSRAALDLAQTVREVLLEAGHAAE